MPQQLRFAATARAAALVAVASVVGGLPGETRVTAQQAASSAAREAPTGPERFARDIDTFRDWDEKNAAPADAVLFVGSSSIRLWSTAVDFPDLPVINRGFGGSQIPDVLHYLDDVALKYRPAVVVLYAGDNDINSGRTPEQVLDDYRTFVGRIRAARADTRVVYIPIKPSIARWKLWPTMARANELVREYSDTDAALFYADVATPMLPADGSAPPADLFVADGLHLSADGYAIWTAAVRPVIDRARSSD